LSLGSFLSLQTIIIGEVFLLVFAVGGYLVYSLLSLNNDLNENNSDLTRKLKNAKSRAKGLRIKIQELHSKISGLEKQMSQEAVEDKELTEKLLSIEKQNQMLQQQTEALNQENKKAKQDNQSLSKDLKRIETELKNKSKEPVKTQSSKENYKELYYDLKNSIAYNMTGGEQAIDLLRDRLVENGNVAESEQVDLLKERYNSIGTMVGMVEDVEIFGSNEENDQEDAELKVIEQAEALVDGVQQSLKNAESLTQIDRSNSLFTQEEMDLLIEDLQKVNHIKDGLVSDLEKTSSQLRAFIAKARMFQAQKEQIKIHKSTEAQLHRNLTNLGSEYRQLSRRFKTLEARNEILNSQIKRSTKDEELIDKLGALRSELETKEELMDRLILEKEMLEQQFMLMSVEADIELESSKTLERLEAEHQLLEQQFLELLNEIEETE